MNFEYYCYTVLFGVFYNIALFFFLIVGAIIGKKMMLFFSLGVIVQGLSVFGNIMEMVEDPARNLTTDNVFAIICSVVLSVGIYFFMKRKKTNLHNQYASASVNKNKHEKSVNQPAIPHEQYITQEFEQKTYVVDRGTGEVISETTVVPQNVFSKFGFCRKCGFELVEGSRFCSHCGVEVI